MLSTDSKSERKEVTSGGADHTPGSNWPTEPEVELKYFNFNIDSEFLLQGGALDIQWGAQCPTECKNFG